MEAYIGIIHHDPGTAYGISFPDFPGCISAGATLGEVLIMGQEALGFHIDSMQKDGDAIPAPRTLDAIQEAGEVDGGMPVVVAPNMAPAVQAKVNLSIDSRILARIDRHAERAGKTRSAFMVEAAMEAMA